MEENLNVKNENGSIAMFVLIGLLFMTSFLLISLGSNINKSKIAKEQFNIMSSIYSYGDGDENAYDRAYTALRKKNKSILTTSVENSSTIELTKTFEDKLSNYRIYGNSATEKLPEEYQEVEWIGTDENSWFVSNFNINNLDKFTIYYSYNANGTDTNYMWGASSYPASDGSRFLHRYNKIMINDASNAVEGFSIPVSNDWESISIIANNIDKTITCYNNGAVYSTSSWSNKKDFDNFGILCNNYDKQPSSYKAINGSKIAEFRVVNDDTGEDVFNLIPCYRKSDGVIGMYDLVSKVFYTNEGTGTFTKGNDVQYKIPIKVSAKNLVNIPDMNIKFADYYENYFPQNPTLLLQPNTKYTVSFDYIINSATTTVKCGIGYGTTEYLEDIVYHADYPNQTQGRFEYTFTTPETFSSSVTPYLQFRFVRGAIAGSFDVEISNVQVELGEKATSYEPYKGKEFNIFITSPLKEGDYIDFKLGKVIRASGTEETVELPELLTYEDYTRIEVLTEVVPSKIEVDYVGYSVE